MSIVFCKFANTVLTFKGGFLIMMNEKGLEVNTAIGCGVTECKYNRSGDYCTLRKIHVGNTCSCDSESCTCCDSFEKK
jgi:hypothetical protein